jgi:hypothetical protein
MNCVGITATLRCSVILLFSALLDEDEVRWASSSPAGPPVRGKLLHGGLPVHVDGDPEVGLAPRCTRASRMQPTHCSVPMTAKQGSWKLARKANRDLNFDLATTSSFSISL